MEKKENYRYTEDGVLLVRKTESGRTGNFGSLFYDRELWFRCSEKDPDRQYLQMVLGGWFGLHKFLEKKYWQGIFYLLTCGCFGVFYLYDLFAMFVGDYSYKAVTYVEEDEGLKRIMQKIYYKPLEKVLFPFLLQLFFLLYFLLYILVQTLFQFLYFFCMVVCIN